MTKAKSVVNKKTGGSKDRFWIPRFWDGMTTAGWTRVLLQNRCAVSPHRWVMAGLISGFCAVNSGMSLLQQLALGRRIAQTELEGDPIFIIGHWRSGTTLLHEYLVRDPKHTYPDTYTCFSPSHFLITSSWLRPALGWLLPKKRPMDNMAVGWDRPQEDEFAICNLSLPSPYLSMIFPNRPPMDQEYFDFEGVEPAAVEQWKRGFHWFLQCVTYANRKRIVLKSPPHTARLRILLEMFPNARFIHLHRDPYVLFPSTVNLWMRLSKDQGLQTPRGEGMEEYVLATFERLYAAYRRDRELVPANRLTDLAYDDLVRDPVAQLERIYGELALEGLDSARPHFQAFADSQREYTKNQYSISPDIGREITERWAWYFDKFGYERKY